MDRTRAITQPQHHFEPAPRSAVDQGSSERRAPDDGSADPHQAQELIDQAARCRRLARATTDATASKILVDMARDYAESAAKLQVAD